MQTKSKAAVKLEDLKVIVATLDRQHNESGTLHTVGTICLLLEMPNDPEGCMTSRKPKEFLNWRLPACTVFFGILPPLFTERQLVRMLLRGPSCSMADCMEYSIAAPQYGSEAALLLAPLSTDCAKRQYSWAGVQLCHLSPPFKRLALMMVFSWTAEARYLLNLHSCPSGEPGAASQTALNETVSVECAKVLGQHLHAASQESIRMRAVALALDVPEWMLPTAEDVEELAARCRLAVQRLALEPPLQEVVIEGFVSLEQVRAHPTTPTTQPPIPPHTSYPTTREVVLEGIGRVGGCWRVGGYWRVLEGIGG